MNRQLKFRAKTKKGKWLIGMPTYDFEYIFNDRQYDSVDNYEIVKDTVSQFTGLKDKNEKEIYEGDILKTGTDKPMVVGWSEKFASFVLNRKGWAFSHWFGESCNPEDCEIIGNKYENAELLQDAI